MSESIVRKVQPFTIGTRLSVPAVPKCPDFTQSYLQSQSLDNCALQQHNLNDRVTLYLSRSQARADGPRLAPPAKQRVTPVRHRQREDMADDDEDHLNRNAVSPNAVSRSIRKITISGSREAAGGMSRPAVGSVRPLVTSSPKSENINNNNNNFSSPDSLLPRIVGVSCENKPSSHFKVLLRKDSNDEQQANTAQRSTLLQLNKSSQQTSGPRARSPRKDQQRRESPPNTHRDGSTAAESQNDCFTQRNSLFNREILQAEAWIKGKLQDLRDGSNVQRCPLRDWEEVAQTLQRDLRDFENTLIQLNQMGEQLICKPNPTADLVRKQLSQLRDQWQTLKQTAANQTRALGGARNLQEFNKKVDKLEFWIKEKQEEEQSLAGILGENIDKLQLTRRVLDLKQDEQLYRNLHEEINHLAVKLEKQGKTEGKNISTRRKHINKMWLKVQSHLKDYHENLQLALEVSSFYQQAENTLFSIKNMRKSMSLSKDTESSGDREIRDIASQIMMLDVTVSQLSNLHPGLAARVTLKQGEVKECWAVLQRALRFGSPYCSPTRSERVPLAPGPPAPAFTREDSDPLTPAREPQCSVGTPAHWIMGKEVKEEQNRLKGCGSSGDCGTASAGKTPSSQGSAEDRRSPSHAPSSPQGDGPACEGGDVSARRQAEGESRKQRAELRSAAAPRGHPPLGAQLQKFTVSADKTLSWLKDNVAMATQVCSMTSTEGLEAAKRCQNILEQEILTNRARIEVVKKEGRGLVRAQHPGSVRIQEFLSQLEVLWDELRRRHQRNATVLQASEELGFRAVKVLQALGSLEAWLESVELSVRESSLSGDPATMSAAERESCLLEGEVAARGLELRTLRREAERLGGQGHPHARQLPARMEEVERKYRSVQSALTQQSSELQDTRMLTEFLERVELEESQENRGGLELPLHSEISSAPALLGLQVGGGAAPLLQSMGDPVEELREAVEMLNDTVRERGRSQSHDQAVLDLLSRHASLTVRIEERLSRSRELIVDVLERETEMVVKCEPDRCGLEGLQEQQDHLEIDYKAIGAEAEEMERLASRLEELCPERVHALGTEVRATLQTWAELGRSVAEGGGRLRQFVQLQDFFRSYLAMISWTEDTRSCIFSDSALYLGKEGQEPMAAELDLQIDLKFEEFEELAAAGAELLEAEHHLAEMIRERTEELRSMLGWILVHWRAQKQQWSLRRKRKEEEKEEEEEEEEAAATGDNIYSEATVCSPLREDSPPDSQQPSVASVCEDRPRPAAADGPPSALTSRLADPAATSRLSDPQAEGRHDDGYEVMSRIGPWGGDVTSAAAAAAPEGPSPPFLVLREPSSPALGGTVNLILSFGDGPDDGRAQLHEPCPRMDEEEQGVQSTEPLHRVSTYLHVKDNNMAAAPVYESITLPRLRGQTRPPAASNSASSSSSSSSPPSSPSSSSPAGGAVQISSVSFPSLPMGGGGGGGGGSNSTSIFSSLKRMSKKRKRKRDARRHTIQRIMGVELAAEGPSVPERDSPPPPPPPAAYDTQTWPLKEARRRKKNAPKNTPGAGGAELTEYVRNPLAGDIDAECYSITPYAVSEGPPPPALLSPPGQVRSHCRFLSLGSVLTFDLPKDMSLIPSIQDVITIGEVRRGERTAATDPHMDRSVTALSSFKQGRPPPSHKQNPPPEKVRGSTDWPGTQSQTHAIPPEAPSDPDDDAFPPPPPPAAEDDQTVPCGDDLSAAPFACSGTVSLHDELECGRGGRTAVGLVVPVVPVAASGKPRPSAVAVHTLDPDPNRHRRHPKTTRCGQRESPGVQRAQGPSQASHMVVNLKSGTVVAVAAREDSVDSGISSSGSLRLGADAPSSGTPEDPQPRGVVGRVISLEVGGLDCAKPRLIPPPAPPSAADAEPVHPDHQQFEEEEEELEDIWNRTNSYRQSICSDIMYQPHQEEEEEEEEEGVGALPDRPSDTPSPKPQAVLYRKLVTASAPNLLVAEFTLPSAVQCMLGYRKGESPRRRDELPPPGKKDRRSWTAFPDREQPRRQPSAPVNETAADPVTLPEIEDQKIYIYQYREEEEEEEEERGKEEEEEEEDTGCPKDRSMSLLSVHMGPEGSAPRAAMHLDSQDEEREEQGLGLATGGRHNTLSMEGILDRKHRLQLGGKKAPSRAWGSYHAVLYRQTLGFYQDKKDTLRSSVCGLPLNLIGAECAPAPDYTKKPNCFSLRLRDGSEYLLSASSRLMMNKWMLEIQANAGLNEPVTVMSSPSAQDLPITTSSSLSSSCLCLAKCHGSAHRDVTSSVPRRAHAGAARAQEIVVLSRESGRPTQCGPARQRDPSPSSPPHAGRGGETSGALAHGRYGSPRESSSLSPCAPASSSQDRTSHKQRSHSFTSATYQKIKPVPLLPGGRGRDGGSSYSVTLVIGDKPADSASTGESSASPQLLGWQQDSALRSYASLPRPPRNKSVFKKFFGKKD